MKNLNTTHLKKCIDTLEASLKALEATQKSSINYDIFRNATIKGFELTLETSGKLLRKAIKLYSENPSTIDRLTYKEVIRLAHKHQLLSEAEVTRWFQYRDNRNNTAHDYGEAFAEETLHLIEAFLKDVGLLQKKLDNTLG